MVKSTYCRGLGFSSQHMWQLTTVGHSSSRGSVPLLSSMDCCMHMMHIHSPRHLHIHKIFKKMFNINQAVVAHAFNPSTGEAETGGSLWVWGQPGLQELVPAQALEATEKSFLWNRKTNTQINKNKNTLGGSFIRFSSKWKTESGMQFSPGL